MPAPARERPRVLLVEDHIANVTAMKVLLQHFGYACDVAADGAVAMEKLIHNSYHAVLMDINLPGKSGLEVTRLIRELEAKEKRRRLYIIGVTAHFFETARKSCFECGMDAHMTKPVNFDELKKHLSAAGDGAQCPV